MTKKQKKTLDLINSYYPGYTIKKRKEYLTLFFNDSVLCDGEIEVDTRLKQLVRELGIVDDTISE